MNDTRLPFNTPEEKLLVFKQAKEEEPIAVAFLQKYYSLFVWPHAAIKRVNELMIANHPDSLIQSFIKLGKESERCRKFKRKEESVDVAVG